MRKMRGQGIVRVSDLFKKYAQTLRAPQKTVINTFIAVIKDLFQIDIKPEHCSYTVNTQTLSLSISGMLKTEILLQKQLILSRMAETLGERSVPKDIR